MEPKALRSLLRKLRRDFPARLPVRVRQRFIPLGEAPGRCFGHTNKNESHFAIVLHSTMPESLALEMLLHEWAHALTWSERVDHSPRWAAKYAELRRWYQGEGEWEGVE